MSANAEPIESQLDVKELLEKILIELRIMNKFNELGHDEVIDEDSVHEDRRR
jgi:hypothetical protein